ncbi:HAMP domain-containing protein [Treponema zuelzerae]|uniref:HAMP domain-containing protein n=1 Tax=Teretinema zuelzerae TaxID=156 RepID=A0AAE3JJ85_9SPIR|nr:methyl-accepting chemotaxis protein [Teretinema zuelzerae]MCD1655228.1 HAMP domain-containing protein [Teretinema zuelzerae]
MTIRRTLLSQTVFVVIAVVLVTVIFIATLRSMERIDRERSILSDLARACVDFTAATNSLDSNTMAGARERFVLASEVLDRAFDRVDGITELNSAGGELASAVQIVKNLRPLADAASSEVLEIYDLLAMDVKRYFFEIQSVPLIRFYTNEYTRQKYDLSDVYGRLDVFFTKIAGASATMTSLTTTIAEQESLITDLVEQRKTLGVGISVLISILLSLFLAAYTLLTGKSIGSRVSLIEDALIPMGNGDLTAAVPESGSDEISAIAGSVNRLRDNLSLLIRDTKIKVAALRGTGLELSAEMEETSASILRINERISDNKLHLEAQEIAVKNTAESVVLLDRQTKQLDAEVNRQAGVIEHSASSVEELLANISSLAATTEKVSSAAGDLVLIADSGRERIDSVSEAVRSVNESSDNLLAAAKVISMIAARTNLLAMNAAIEAAHAGSAGLGFAVVADEIRSLANQSSEQAKRVSADLREAKDRLQVVSGLSEEANSSFHGILAHVREVSELIDGVGIALEEQNAGSTSLLTGISDLRAIGSRVRIAAEEMRGANSLIQTSVSRLSETTSLVNDNNAEILTGTGEINKAVASILDLTESNRSFINDLEADTSRFIVV